MILSDISETGVFAKKFANTLKAGDIVALMGEVGAGKTHLCREIIRHFCGDNIVVPSPTFNILQTYRAENFTIFHYDFYRLKNIHEVYELGLEDAFNNNLCLIEWPEIVTTLLPESTIWLNIEIISNDKRAVIVNYSNSL